LQEELSFYETKRAVDDRGKDSIVAGYPTLMINMAARVSDKPRAGDGSSW